GSESRSHPIRASLTMRRLYCPAPPHSVSLAQTADTWHRGPGVCAGYRGSVPAGSTLAGGGGGLLVHLGVDRRPGVWQGVELSRGEVGEEPFPDAAHVGAVRLGEGPQAGGGQAGSGAAGIAGGGRATHQAAVFE